MAELENARRLLGSPDAQVTAHAPAEAGATASSPPSVRERRPAGDASSTGRACVVNAPSPQRGASTCTNGSQVVGYILATRARLQQQKYQCAHPQRGELRIRRDEPSARRALELDHAWYAAAGAGATSSPDTTLCLPRRVSNKILGRPERVLVHPRCARHGDGIIIVTCSPLRG